MNTLDRYIARQYLMNVVVLLLILFSFVVVIDASLNLPRFVKIANVLATETGGPNSDPNNGPNSVQAPGFIRSALATVLVIADLWWPRLLQLFNFLIGLVLVAAMGFTCSQLSRHREFIAMLAAGISLQRVGRPILVIAALVSVIQLANQEFAVPRIAPLLERDHKEAGRRGLEVTSVPLTADGQRRLFRADQFDADTSTLTGLYIMERDETGRASRVITADSAIWDGDGWTLTNGLAARRVPLSAPTAAAVSRAPVPIDHVQTALSPTELKLNQYRTYRNALSFVQASRLLKQRDLLDPRDAANYQRIRWGRFAVVATNLLTLVIAMPFFITREPGNMVVQSLKCSPIAIAALMGGVLGSASGIPGIPATLGVFIPVMLLITVAIAAKSFLKT
ncbi:MAG: lipopolysaccharide export LptBFGC system permease protein LptF [Phycisphaerales bacterium]|jgi:lipopolysaccharide export LptBFGC system permease protein LptF